MSLYLTGANNFALIRIAFKIALISSLIGG